MVKLRRQWIAMSKRGHERADAVRNRRAILAAAADLLDGNDPVHVSMDQVAARAGVAKGTVFNRFGSRQGLVRALLDERAAALRDAVGAGPPPLGPGAPAPQRLAAFLDASIEFVVRNLGLMAASDRAAASRHEEEPMYAFGHRHLSTLLAEARPDLDADMLARIMLASLHTDLVAGVCRRGEADRLAGSLRTLAAALLRLPDRKPP